MIDKLLQKNTQFSYRWLGRINQHHDTDQESLYRTALKQFLMSYTEVLKGKHVLDVGSGSWNWTKQTFSPICNITTFDIVGHENVDVTGDLYHLDIAFPGEPSFDVIIATDVFEHVARTSEALAQIKSVLKTDGLLIASTPFKKNLHGEDYGDYWRITRQGWQHLLQTAGFENISIEWMGEELLPIAYLLTAKKL